MGAKIVLVLLSQTYFKSRACQKEFKRACALIDPRAKNKKVIPVVVEALPWRYPGNDDNGACPPDLQADLAERNCFPDPKNGCLMDQFGDNMALLMEEMIAPVLGNATEGEECRTNG